MVKSLQLVTLARLVQASATTLMLGIELSRHAYLGSLSVGLNILETVMSASLFLNCSKGLDLVHTTHGTNPSVRWGALRVFSFCPIFPPLFLCTLCVLSQVALCFLSHSANMCRVDPTLDLDFLKNRQAIAMLREPWRITIVAKFPNVQCRAWARAQKPCIGGRGTRHGMVRCGTSRSKMFE